MKRAYLSKAILLILMCAATIAYSAEPAKHVLAKGETLYSVSRIYKIPYEALAAANGITDPTKLRIGTELIIPSIHIVSRGETLYGISRQYGIPVSELLQANKLNLDYMLKIGDTLIVPAAATAESTGTTAPATTIAAATTTTTIAAATTTTTIAAATTTTKAATTTTTVVTATPPKPVSPIAATTTPAASSAPVNAGTPTQNAPSATSTTIRNNAVSVPIPEPVKIQDKSVDMHIRWPAEGKVLYLDGKLEGVMIHAKLGDKTKAIASGTVVSAGPSRGFNQVVFVQAKSGYVYVYGGNESLAVQTGDQVQSGRDLGIIGMDGKSGTSTAYFFVFRNGQPIDPATAPRD